ncbi:MAG: M28 family metallopeptidase [Candidatus Hodarchaeales archaeon]
MTNEDLTKIDPSGKTMINFIDNICKEVGPRLAGTPEEKRAGDIIYNKFKTFCDEVTQEEFSCHPQGFLDFIKIVAILYLLAVLSYYFIDPLVTIFLIIAALSIYVIQQNLLWEFVDFLFPKKTSYHIIGKIFPKKEAKKLVLLSGHHDSAYEFPLFSKLGEKSGIIVISAVAVSIFNIVFALIKLSISRKNNPAYSSIDILQSILFILGLILIFLITFTLHSNIVVLGANDNLSAVAAVLECGEILSNNKMENTEVWLISFAGEEHMRGSKRFVKRHFDELKTRNALLLNLECLSAEKFLLATSEPMFLAKHSNKVVTLVKNAADKLGISIDVGLLPFAGSDSANFSRKGLHAATIFGLSKTGLPSNWHTVNDTPENLNGKTIAEGANIALQFVRDIDQINE